MDKMLKYLLIGGAAYAAYKAFSPKASGVSGLGQEFPSAVLPMMSIGMGPAVVPSGTFDIGAQFPLTGEAEMRINPDTGLPMWYRTTPIEGVIGGQYYDIRNDLQRNFPDWVVRKERQRREQLLLDTNASGAMRTALDFTPEQGVAVPSGWKVANMFGLGTTPPKRRVSGDIGSHLSMMMGMGGDEIDWSTPSNSGGGTVSMPQDQWDYLKNQSAPSSPSPSASMTAKQATGSSREVGYSGKTGFAPWAGPNAGTPWGGPAAGPTGPTATKKAKGPSEYIDTGVSASDILAQASQTIRSGQAAESETIRKLESIGVNWKGTMYKPSLYVIGGQCNYDKAKKYLGPQALPSLGAKVYEFDDCFLISEGGSIRRVQKTAQSGGDGGGGPDYWGQYDDWLRRQPYGARTSVKSAQWQGEDPSLPMVGPDWGGGDELKLSLSVTGGGSPAVSSPSSYQSWPSMPSGPTAQIFNVGQGPSLQDGTLQELF